MSACPDVAGAVERRLVEVASAEGATPEEVAGITRLWRDAAAAVDVSRTQKPGTWAAAVYYASLRVRFDGATQAEAADLFGVSVQSVTARFGQIDAALRLDAFDARYTPEAERPESFRAMDEALGRFDEAHAHSDHHRPEIEASAVCGCFYCLATFPPGAVEAWIDEGDGGQTALCPACGVDSVIGDASGVPIAAPFLQAMRAVWFGAGGPDSA